MIFIKKTKHFYKRLAEALADMIFANQVRVQAPVASYSDMEDEEEDLVDGMGMSEEEEVEEEEEKV